MDECNTCTISDQAVGGPRWKAPLMFVGALLFCPCHLPVTFGVVAALGGGLTGAYWLFGNQAVVYAFFSVVYVILLAWMVRWFIASRDRERAIEQAHQLHVAKD